MFACATCGSALTVPLTQVPLPAHAGQHYSHELLGALMEPGTYAVRPYPAGPPWRRWDEVGETEAAARGVYAPVYSLSDGPPGAVAVAPGDVRGTAFIPDRLDGYCYGVDGREGPNLACERCGTPVATRIDDCASWQAVWLEPQAIQLLPAASPPSPPLGWETLRRHRPETPPVELDGSWDPRSEAAVGVALAHLLAASGGACVTVPDGPVAAMFRRALDFMCPPGPSARTLVLGGPGLPAVTAAIALVPQHPQTGEHWAEPGAAAVVSLAWDVWAYLAFHRERRPVPGGGALRDEIHRDDPPPRLPNLMFQPDRDLFLFTLARLPEVGQLAVRAIYDRVNTRYGPLPF
ncbi:hypothetical protein [Catellatospora vulcania]|uniref:hypothetical protein n=1 Tax=Catellatospora vulcania TaxID=1460450 RepID=UPI001E5552BE|nr:hypothetical protein [Catellatospora vulcania]